tara:strand:+ start:170 stop:499 length:330 start_codon:yes stop_codon:yes gene_type:complete
MSGNIKNRAEFKEYVKKHPVIIVKFTADWCGPCKKVAPHIYNLMAKYYDINYLVVDVDEARDISSYLKIRSIPTLVSFINNGDIHEFLSSSSLDDITAFFKKTNAYCPK